MRVGVFGNLCVDWVVKNSLPFALDENSNTDEIFNLNDIEEAVGGTAFHISKQLRLAGMHVVPFGVVGDDPGGQLIRDELQRREVSDRSITNGASPTSRIIIASDAKGRRIMIAQNESANDELSVQSVEDAMDELTRLDSVWISGVCLRNRSAERLNAIARVLEITENARIPSILDLVPHEFHKHYTSFEELFDCVGRFSVVVSETSTARRMMRLGSPEEAIDDSVIRETATRLLNKFEYVSLRHRRSSHWHQLIMDRHSHDFSQNFDFKDVTDMRGFGDRMAANLLEWLASRGAVK